METCPLPSRGSAASIQLAHGEGGRAWRDLLRDTVGPALKLGDVEKLNDAALLPRDARELAITTDAFVVTPRTFPGGDLGRLSVLGTANDLAAMGAVLQWLTLSLVVEEGFALAELQRHLESAAHAVEELQATVVAGDTKVVPRGQVDGLFITTTGVGKRRWRVGIAAELEPGDRLLVTGPIGRHGAAIMAARGDLQLEPPLPSDLACLYPIVEALGQAGVAPRALRDATRGGMAAVLHEWAAASGHSLAVDESRIPIDSSVRGVTELLGLQPLHLACEGTMVVAVRDTDMSSALTAMRATTVGREACEVGTIVPRDLAGVLMRRATGTWVPLDEPRGAPLPRIC